MGRLRCLLYALSTLVSSCVFLVIQRLSPPVEFPRMLLTIFKLFFFFSLSFFPPNFEGFFIEGNFYPWNNARPFDMKIIKLEIRRGEAVRGVPWLNWDSKWTKARDWTVVKRLVECQCLRVYGNKFSKQVQWQEQKVRVKGYSKKEYRAG